MFAVVAACLGGDRVAVAAATMHIAVRFHIAADLVMVKDGLQMRSWITEGEVRDIVLPEVNRIWQPAGIRFVLDKVVRARLLNPPDSRQLIDEIAASHRNEDGESDPERIRKLGRLIDVDAGDGSGIDIFLVPYLGEASQGNTKRRLRRVVVAQWTDKPTRGRQPPERFALTERGPLREGSLSRTVAHELGHVLGLAHPDKRRREVTDLLMGGRRPGYDLTDPEIETARGAASVLSTR